MKNKKKRQLSFTTYEAYKKIKKNDPLKIIFESMDWSFIYPLIKDKYITGKGLVYNPVTLFKAQLLIWLGEVKSNRKLAENLQFNSRYCALCGFDNFLKTPAHSTFSHFRRRIGKDIYYKILHRLIAQTIAISVINQIDINHNVVHLVVYSKDKKRSCNCSGSRCKYNQRKSNANNKLKKITKNFVVFGFKVRMLIDTSSQLPVEVILEPRE